MRVAQVLRKLNPLEWGGTETAIERLAEGLRDNGVTPVIYCPSLDPIAGHANGTDGFHCEVQRFKAFVPILGLSQQRKRELVSVGGNLMSFQLISALWREPDLAVIHTHTLGRIGGIALTVAKQRRIPFVVTIHGGVLALPDDIKQEFNAPNSEGWEWGKLFGLLFQSHRLFRDADAILTCNIKEAALLRERYPAKHIQVQPHGVPLQLYQEDQRAVAREAFPAICGKQVLLSVGRIDPIKNQSWLVDQAPAILERHPRSILVLAGACTHAAYGEQLRKQIKHRDLEHRVLLTEGLPSGDSRLIGLYQEAKALVLPSVSETFGIVILEAWAAGTVPIASRTTGASALVQDGEDGFLFDLGCPETFHQALDRALTAPDLARGMTLRGAEKVRNEYSLAAVAGQLKRLYVQITEERSCAT